MNSNVYKVLVTALVLCAINCSAQLERPYVPPSPNASALARTANVSVGYYTGVPEISFPLAALGGKDISIPISVDYHASGIKVQDVAGSAGLGFSLNAGGAITRIVRGIPDGLQRNCTNGIYDYWSNIHESCDGEKDIFFFSIPGRTGKIVVDDQGFALTMPYQDLKINAGVGPLSSGYWRITDENGYTYYFGEHSAEIEQSTYSTGNATSGYTQKYTFTSTWYLNRIVSPAGQDIATFTYSPGNDFEYEVYHEQAIISSTGNMPAPKNVNTKVHLVQPKYLNTISTNLGSAVFAYNNNRNDLPNSWQLNSFVLKDINGVAMKGYQFVMDYFANEDGGNGHLRLLSIKEGLQSSITQYSFSYFEAPIVSGVSTNPSRQSIFYDHYGYFNKSSNAGCGLMPVYTVGFGCLYQGASKSPGNDNEHKYYTLKNITDALGGKTVFDYESSNGRGLRVKSISNYNGTTMIAQSTYTYSGSATTGTPVYSFTTYDNSTVWTSSSFKDLFDINGVSVGYSTVTETLMDGSKIERGFTNFTDQGCNDTNPIVGKYQADPPSSQPGFQGFQDVNGPPFTSPSTHFWMRGLPKAVRVFDNQNHLLRIDSMKYQQGPYVGLTGSTAVFNYQQTGGSNPKVTYISGDYVLGSYPVQLVQSKSYLYDQSDFVSYKLDVADYEYLSNAKTFPSAITTTVGTNGPKKKVTFKYAQDIVIPGETAYNPSIDELNAIYYLVTNNIIVPIEKVNYFKDWNTSSFKVIGGKLLMFKVNTSNNRALLKNVYELAIGSPISSLTPEVSISSDGQTFNYDNTHYRLMETFTFDQSTSRMTQVTGSNGITDYFEWGSGFNNALITGMYNQIGTVQYKTQYNYNTIYGLLSRLDANNRFSYYNYDNLGRLKMIKDHDGNIISRFRYNYGNTNEFGVSFSMSRSSAAIGQSVTFTSTNNAETIGQSKYVWDFGDGQTLETASVFTSHSYSSVGTYTVKLAKINPEYGSVMTTQTLTVYPPPSVSISGCSSIDLCATNPSCTFSAIATGGCGPLTYTWYSRPVGGSWSNFASGVSVSYYPEGVGSFEVKCTVSDGPSCGNTADSSPYSVNAYRSSNCPQN